MAQIAGFRGAVWDPSKVDLAKVASSPLTHAHVKDKLAKGELVRDPTRAVYRYHQVFEHGGRTHTRATLVAAVRLTPWSEGLVRPHEETEPTARDAAVAAISECGAHCEPVFLGYRDASREVDRVLRGAESGKPTLEVTTPDGTRHKLWRVANNEIIGRLRPLFAPKKLHVLDGHARYEGMLAYADKIGRDAQSLYSSAQYGLACLTNIEEPTVITAARHRLIRNEGIKRDAVLEASRKYFIVEKVAGAAHDAKKQLAALGDSVAHQPAFMATFANDADAWKLTLKPDVSLSSEGIEVDRAVQRYEPVVVEKLFVRRVLQTTGTTSVDAQGVLDAVKAGAAVGVLMRPLEMNQIVHADEVGALLPFGSTAFTPPLATLLAYFVDPDEDLV